MKSLQLACVGVLVSLFAGGAAVGAEATYILSGGMGALNHTVNGYSQVVSPGSGGETVVRVSVAESPVGSSARWTPGVSTSTLRLPSTLEKRFRPGQDAYGRATEILRWVAENLSVNTEDFRLQDALSVLRRGEGRCSGIANATVGLLTTTGFRARTVSGLLVSGEGEVPHRWLECHLPGAGWVPTDPTLGFWIVTPRHVVFADTVIDPPLVRIVSMEKDAQAPSQLDGRPIRPDRGAELLCRVVGEANGPIVAVLRRSEGEERRTLLGPEGRISGLFPGRWLFELEVAGEVVQRQTLVLGPGSTHSVVVDLARLEPFGNL